MRRFKEGMLLRGVKNVTPKGTAGDCTSGVNGMDVCMNDRTVRRKILGEQQLTETIYAEELFDIVAEVYRYVGARPPPTEDSTARFQGYRRQEKENRIERVICKRVFYRTR